MNKTFLKAAFAAALAFIMPATSNAQLGDLLNSVASKVSSSSSTASTVTDVITSIIGTSKVSESSLVGTWTYKEPCIAAESSNILSKAAAAAAASKAQSQLGTVLGKAGIKAGTMKIVFQKDGTAQVSVGSKTVAATYKVDGSNLLLTFTKLKKTVTMNCKLSAGRLQLSMKADKLLTLINAVSSTAAAASSSLSTLSTLLKSVDGLYVGLQFTK